MESKIETVTRWSEIDGNGHVSNSKYLDYLGWGRSDWYAKSKFTLEALYDKGIQTAVVNININFCKELMLDEKIWIVTRPERIGRSSYVFKQEVLKHTGELCMEALVTSVMMDVKTRKSIRVPIEFRKLFIF